MSAIAPKTITRSVIAERRRLRKMFRMASFVVSICSSPISQKAESRKQKWFVLDGDGSGQIWLKGTSAFCLLTSALYGAVMHVHDALHARNQRLIVCREHEG